MKERIVVEKNGKNLKGEVVDISGKNQLIGGQFGDVIGRELFMDYISIVISWKVDFIGSVEKVHMTICLDVHNIERRIESYVKDNVFEATCDGELLNRIENSADKPFFQVEMFPEIVSHINKSVNSLVQQKKTSNINNR